MPSLDWKKEAEKLSKIVVKETPFVLIARVKVKPGEVENYLKIASAWPGAPIAFTRSK